MKRFPLASKIVLLVFLTLVMMLPITAIMELINERTYHRKTVVEKIANSTSGPQTLVGPIIVIPYQTTRVEINEVDGKQTRRNVTTSHVHYLLPETLDVSATAQVEARKLGIYQAQLYESRATIQGRFKVTTPLDWSDTDKVKAGQPYLT